MDYSKQHKQKYIYVLNELIEYFENKKIIFKARNYFIINDLDIDDLLIANYNNNDNIKFIINTEYDNDIDMI